MRMTTTLTLAIALTFLLAAAERAAAVTITGGTGPGGVGTTNGASSLSFWGRPETLSAGLVSSWTDSSGSGFTLTDGSATEPTFVTGVLNSGTQGVVRFNGSTDGLSVASFNGSIDRTIFSVTARGDTSHNPTVQQRSNAGNSYGWGGASHTRIYNVEENVALEALSTSTFAIGEFNIATGQWDGSGNELFINGESEATNGDTVLGSAGQTLFLGTHLQTGRLNGDIAEVAIFDAKLSSAQRLIVDNYLSAKFDIAMNDAVNNDRYAGDDGVNGDYDSDVFGIGQLDAVAFSSSGSAGFGIEAISGLDNDDFALAGHKVESNSQLSHRWDRAWYLDNQLDGDEDLSLAFDWSDGGLGSANPDFLELMFSSTDGGPFTSIALGSLVGDTVTFASLTAGDLANGYYTLGRTPPVPEPSSFMLLGLATLGLALKRKRHSSKGACKV